MPSTIGYAALQKRTHNLHSDEGRRTKRILELGAKHDESVNQVSEQLIQLVLDSAQKIGFENAVNNVAYCLKTNTDWRQRDIKSISTQVYDGLKSLLDPFK